jgi:hypothetical protein
MGFSIRLFVASAALSLALAAGFTGAAAQDVTKGLTADALEALLDNANMSPDIVEDRETGAPVAIGQIGQINFVVRALDCEGRPQVCSQLLFFANFDLGRDATEDDYRIVNDFNDSSVEGRAYVLEDTKQIGVDYYIDLTGGVTDEHVTSRLNRWQGVIEGFLQEMRAASTGS